MTCPGCRLSMLRPVAGGLGRMGACHRCGWTGPLRPEFAGPLLPAEPLEPCDETEELDPIAVAIVEKVRKRHESV